MMKEHWKHWELSTDRGRQVWRFIPPAHLSRDGKDEPQQQPRAIMLAPQVLECHATSGDHDYMLKIVAPDMASYQDFLSDYLLKIGVVRTVNTSFALRQQKNTTALPLDEM